MNGCTKCAPYCDASCPTRQTQADERDALLRLRALRLWHYRQLLQARTNQRAAVSGALAERYNAEASTHLGFVQSLNDFFANGDTAEHDDNREDAA